MDYFVQLAFGDGLKELLLKVHEFVGKYGESCSPYLSAFLYPSEELLLSPPSAYPVPSDNVLTLRVARGTEQGFPSWHKCEVDENWLSNLYYQHIQAGKGVNPRLNFLVYLSPEDSDDIGKLGDLMQRVPANLNIFFDVVLLSPDLLSSDYSEQEIRKSLSTLSELKEKDARFREIIFLQGINNGGWVLNSELTPLHTILGNLLIAMIQGRDSLFLPILQGSITAIGVEPLFIDRFRIIDNWFHHWLHDTLSPYRTSQANVDGLLSEKLNSLYEKAAESLKGLGNNADKLKSWKEEMASEARSALMDPALTPQERTDIAESLRPLPPEISPEDFGSVRGRLFKEFSIGKDSLVNCLREISEEEKKRLDAMNGRDFHTQAEAEERLRGLGERLRGLYRAELSFDEETERERVSDERKKLEGEKGELEETPWIVRVLRGKQKRLREVRQSLMKLPAEEGMDEYLQGWCREQEMQRRFLKGILEQLDVLYNGMKDDAEIINSSLASLCSCQEGLEEWTKGHPVVENTAYQQMKAQLSGSSGDIFKDMIDSWAENGEEPMSVFFNFQLGILRSMDNFFPLDIDSKAASDSSWWKDYETRAANCHLQAQIDPVAMNNSAQNGNACFFSSGAMQPGLQCSPTPFASTNRWLYIKIMKFSPDGFVLTSSPTEGTLR